jgi:hypothetical protein
VLENRELLSPGQQLFLFWGGHCGSDADKLEIEKFNVPGEFSTLEGAVPIRRRTAS